MRTLTVIGVSKDGGFGSFLASNLSDAYEVTCHGRDVKEADWKLDADVVVLNLFDHKRTLLQSIELGRIFSKVRNTDTILVAIGSTAHYTDRHSGAYAQGKHILNKVFYDVAFNTGEYRCSMLLVEPGSLDNYHGNPGLNFHLKQEDLAKVLRSALELGQKFLHIVVRGAHPPKGEQK